MISRLVFLAMAAGAASAQDMRMMVHPLTDMPDAATDVTASFHFPS